MILCSLRPERFGQVSAYCFAGSELLRRQRLDPLLATSVVAFSALITYVPAYLWVSGGSGLFKASPELFWTEALIQGVIAGAGTLFTYARTVSILGASRASIFPALAPGIAAFMAWPLLGHLPVLSESVGLVIVMSGLIWAVTGGSRS